MERLHRESSKSRAGCSLLLIVDVGLCKLGARDVRFSLACAVECKMPLSRDLRHHYANELIRLPLHRSRKCQVARRSAIRTATAVTKRQSRCGLIAIENLTCNFEALPFRRFLRDPYQILRVCSRRHARYAIKKPGRSDLKRRGC